MSSEFPEDRIIREPECKRMTGTSRATRWRWERAGSFPRRVQIGPNSVGWRLSDLRNWMESVSGEQERR